MTVKERMILWLVAGTAVYTVCMGLAWLVLEGSVWVLPVLVLLSATMAAACIYDLHRQPSEPPAVVPTAEEDERGVMLHRELNMLRRELAVRERQVAYLQNALEALNTQLVEQQAVAQARLRLPAPTPQPVERARPATGGMEAGSQIGHA